MKPIIHEIDGDEYKIEAEDGDITISVEGKVVHNFDTMAKFSEFMSIMRTTERVLEGKE